jgi:hypothetical protein
VRRRRSTLGTRSTVGSNSYRFTADPQIDDAVVELLPDGFRLGPRAEVSPVVGRVYFMAFAL